MALGHDRISFHFDFCILHSSDFVPWCLCGDTEKLNGMNKIGLIAGNGTFPVEFAKAAKLKDLEVIAVAHEGETVPELAQWVDAIFWIKVGQLGKMIDIFKKQGVRDVLMAGGIKKTRMFSGGMPDLRGAAFLARMLYNKDDSLLRGVAAELESEGITVRESTLYLESILAPAGVLTRRNPTKDEWKDLEFGWQMAKEVGKLDIGQTVLVKDRAVLAVEAIEGTDEAIRRGGRLWQCVLDRLHELNGLSHYPRGFRHIPGERERRRVRREAERGGERPPVFHVSRRRQRGCWLVRRGGPLGPRPCGRLDRIG